MKMTPAVQRFVDHWGEMGPKWGVSRSVAQVHALLYLAPEPLPAETIAEALGIARSNVSMSLKELQGWRIIRTTRVRGDRKDHFASVQDVWELFRVVLDERKKRELDPTIAVLQECLELSTAAGADPKKDVSTVRVRAMLAFFEAGEAWYGHVRALPIAALKVFFKTGAKLRGWLGRAS